MASSIKEDFIKKYQAAAKNATAGTLLLPGTILTVAAIEGRYGQSELAAKYNNFFGRKPESGYTGKTVSMLTNENIKGKIVKIMQPFKVYDTPEAGFRDYVRLISRAPRYIKVLKQTTVPGQFKELQAAGYATDPSYAKKLEQLYNELKGFMSTSAVGFLIVGTLFFLLRDR